MNAKSITVNIVMKDNVNVAIADFITVSQQAGDRDS